ncbi:phosphatase PAP2 family protein [Paenibacillus pinistramenti]|uniref:phosphatase PAP2 family protein n=1 Tax=Paenibacillus pinistramenti TaxID=1768003 RepID=UPI0013968095|nr:phosphatase PAP2 family protein [Paenibacillus pinistramenti]
MKISFMSKVLFRSMLLSVVCLSFFIGIALSVKFQHIAGFDLTVMSRIQSVNSDILTIIMKGFTTIGSGLFVVIIAAVLAFFLFRIGYRRELLLLAGIISGSGLLNILLKSMFHRTRPDIHRIIQAGGYSFPSGHSMAAFTLYGITVYFLWRHIPRFGARMLVLLLGTFMVLMIGVSRIYLGVHYPSDVIGGYLMSAVWLTANIGWYEHYLKERWSSSQ